MKFKVKEKVTSVTIELNYEEMVQLRAGLNRLRQNTLTERMRYNLSPLSLITRDPYGGSGEGKFLSELHSKLKEST